MSTGKKAIKEDPVSESPIEMCQRKMPSAAGKRKITSSVLNPVKQIKVVENRAPSVEYCAQCSKKLKFLNTFTCRCKQVLCSRHRFYDQHECSFDFRTEAQSRLRESNPQILPKKLGE